MTAADQKLKAHWPISLLSSCAAVVNMLLPLALVRLLSPEEVGTFKIFFLYVMLLPAFSMTDGLLNGLAYWAGKGRESRSALQLSGLLMLVLAALLFLISFVIRTVVADFFDWPDLYGFIFAVSLFSAVASRFYEEAAISSGAVWRGSIFYSGFEILRTIVVIFTAFHFQTLLAVLVAHSAISLSKALFGYILAAFNGFFSLSVNQDDLKAVWHYAWPVSLASIFAVFAAYGDQFILSTYIEASEFAYYSIGCLAIPPLFILEHSITRVLVPQMSEAFHKGKALHAAELYRSAVRQLAFLIVPAVSGLALFAAPIIELLFTKEYLVSSAYLSIFAFSYLCLIFPFDCLPRARGESRWILKTNFYFSILTLVLSGSLTYYFGAFGALAGLLTAKILMRLYALWYIRSTTAWHISDYLPLKSLIKYVLVASALALLAWLFKPFFISQVNWFLLIGSLYTFIYLLSFYLLKSSESSSDALSSPRKVLMLIPQLVIGGLERMVVELSAELKRQGEYEALIYAYDYESLKDGSDLVASCKAKGLIYQIEKKADGFSLKTVLKLRKYIAQHNISLIHAHDIGAKIYAVILKLLSFGKIKIVHTQHTSLHLKEKSRYHLYERLFTPLVDRLVLVAPGLRDDYRNLALNSRASKLIPNGLSFYDPYLTLLNQEPEIAASLKAEKRKQLVAANGLSDSGQSILKDSWILYLSRIHSAKGQLKMLDVWRLLSDERRRDGVLFLLGPVADKEYLAKLKLEVERFALSDRVFILPGSDDPGSWFAASDIFCSFSQLEGMPLAPLEAIAYGLPALLSDIPGHSFLKEEAMLVDSSHPQYVAEKLSRLIEMLQRKDVHFNQRLKERSRRIQENYSIEAMAKAYLELYKEL